MESSVPFAPSSAERQQPLAQSYLRSAGDIETAGLDDNKASSGSDRGDREVNAVRAIPLP